MSIVGLVAAVQTNSPQIESSHPVAAGYFVIALVVPVLALVVMMFIRTTWSGHRKGDGTTGDHAGNAAHSSR
ncbi:MAG TPA: hypothetical protein VHW46_01330 [Terracidiphilus sp.]|jgi:hypothetical protein|nr:hypothetical protein [Terracidiphilus sp.]